MHFRHVKTETFSCIGDTVAATWRRMLYNRRVAIREPFWRRGRRKKRR